MSKDLTTIMHTEAEKIRVLRVTHTHFCLGDEGDLYITEPGITFADGLSPENYWSGKEWFEPHSEQLSGTSSLYRVTTKKINDSQNAEAEEENGSNI